MQLISVSKLRKQFRQGGVTITVLDDITASFGPGVTVITGVSGSGKSTLLHLLAGLDTPDGGTIIKPATAGIIFQAPYLLTELSVLENVMLKGLIQGRSYESCKQEAVTLLSQVGLSEKANERPTNLSGGQQQRVALARALFGTPDWIFADEPTGNLDQATGKRMLEMVVQVAAERHIGLVIVSHDPYAEQIADSVFNLSDGKLHATRTKTDQSPPGSERN